MRNEQESGKHSKDNNQVDHPFSFVEVCFARLLRQCHQSFWSWLAPGTAELTMTLIVSHGNWRLTRRPRLVHKTVWSGKLNEEHTTTGVAGRTALLMSHCAISSGRKSGLLRAMMCRP